MCGICGYVAFTAATETTRVEAMVAALRHRGPDGSGVWQSSDREVCLGHARLAILDLSDAGAQPMAYRNRYHITYNGEIYNYLELRDLLVANGYRFTSSTDTEVLLALYADKGEECLSLLDGAFAFAIWDETSRTLFCARDRFGEKPFYYRLDSTGFAFASEIKAIVACCGRVSLSQSHIFNFLLYGMAQDVHEPTSTFYEGVRQLDAATYLVLDRAGRVRTRRYWSISPEPTTWNGKDDGAATSRFRELMSISVQRRLRSDVPVGTSLSGGLDSSAVVLETARLKADGQPQRTFSATFPGFVRDERRFAEMVVAETGAEPFYVAPDAASAYSSLRRMMYHQEIPVGSASIAVQLAVMDLARSNGVVVLLDGQGADEILAGYTTYWPSYLMQLYRTDRKRFRAVRAELETLHGPAGLLSGWRLLLATRAQRLYDFMRDTARVCRRPDSEFFAGINPELVRQFRSRPNPITVVPDLRRQLLQSTQLHGLGELLRYADRNAMAHSVEIRLPFLFHELVEFAFSLPDEQRINRGWTKYVLRKSLDPFLPFQVVWRKEKVGYEPPQEEWMRTPQFTELVHEAVADLRKDGTIVAENPRLHWAYVTLYLAKYALA